MKRIDEIIECNADEIIALGENLFKHPELGYKEFKTKEILIDYLKEKGFEIEQEYCLTGFKVSIGSGYPHIGLIAEMDAIPTVGHPCANLNDSSAAHSCGHSTQCTIMVNALLALKEVMKDGMGKVSIYFCPAEEFTDIAYRQSLIKDGKIRYIGGKVNMLTEGIFDDVDLCIHLHAMGNDYQYGINSRLAGFIYKKYTFIGKASHAAVLPHLGVNALNAFALFQSAQGMLRETFKDEDKNRVHGRLISGGETVNSIPEIVEYESYIRSFNSETLTVLNNLYSNAAICCAKAIGATCNIEDTPGYLPFVPSKKLSDVVYKQMLNYVKDEDIIKDEESIAAGDIGDLGCFKPTIQFGYGGVKGVIHGKTMMIADPYLIYITTAKIVANSVMDILNDHSIADDIISSFKPAMTKEEYLEYLNKQA